MTDNESGQDQELDGALEEAGLTREQYNNSPKWEQRRIAQMASTKKAAEHQADEARREAAEARREAAELKGRLEALEGRSKTPAEEPQGLDRFTKVSDLKQVQKKLYEYQSLAVDPDASPEARQAARAELSKIDDVPGMLADISERIADLKVQERLGGFEQQLSEKERRQAGMSQLTQNLFLQYGEDAIRQGSSLQKAAASQIQEWIDSGDVNANNASDPFVVKNAYERAAAKIKHSRGGRGQDPRHSAVESGGGSRGPLNTDAIAALKNKAKAGDWQAGKKASDMELEGFLQGLIGNGSIG